LDFTTTRFLVADRGRIRSTNDLVTYSYLRQNVVDFRRVRKQLQKGTINLIKGESNGKLPPRTCPGCSVPEPYRSHDWDLVPASPASKAEY